MLQHREAIWSACLARSCSQAVDTNSSYRGHRTSLGLITDRAQQLPGEEESAASTAHLAVSQAEARWKCDVHVACGTLTGAQLQEQIKYVHQHLRHTSP